MRNLAHKAGTAIFFVSIAVGLYFAVPYVFANRYNSTNFAEEAAKQEVEDSIISELVETKKVSHIETPEVVKGLYMSSWVAGTTDFRDSMIEIIDTTEVNAVVIDVKDSTGRISFATNDPYLTEIGASENRIRDVDGLIELLHSKGIYVIARIAVFQDPYLVKEWPSEAVKKSSDKSIAWGDRKGMHWIDAGSTKVWDYNVAVGKEAYNRGFDELNFDYIRFPSDGNMKDIYYPVSEGLVKADVMRSFFEHLNSSFEEEGIPISADIFGMTTTNTDDLNIGQILEDAVRNFDYVSPMVYPSHYPATWNGFANPAANPYEVIKLSMQGAVDRTIAIGEDINKLRPWLQDFNMGATYTPSMVREQIDATEDLGIDSWLLWDPANTYTKAALNE
ncbi:MAG: sugar fermentation stimulation protein [Candidatus Pacebacteria bacterium]|nr:sugar fermentation stimulation protein [Candidatus Paceibacterota bacterium]MBP9772527.1 sugar fermentation stimulation protein [Candidatus Paceibacterota bacterium]